MFFPGVRRRAFHLPHAFIPFGLAVVAILCTVVGWAVLAPSNAGLEATQTIGPDITAIRSVAFTVPGKDFDDVVVQPAGNVAARQVIATFPNSGSTGYHAHGASSPLGDQLAVVSLPPFAGRGNAHLAFVSVLDGTIRPVEGSFDYFTRLSWSPDGTKLAAVQYTENESGRVQAIVEIDSQLGTTRTVAEFADALDVVPVGYSFDSQRLFVVVVDQKGSNLYAQRSGKWQVVAELSPGRTRDWTLSPDGARLAFVDMLAGGSRTFVGRTLVIATGAVTTLPAVGNQVGSTWLPGSPVPGFGGPGGSWQLTGANQAGAYLVPAAWSPNAGYLVATIVSDDPNGPGRSLELIQPNSSDPETSRTVLTEDEGAAFLGWVHNLD